LRERPELEGVPVLMLTAKVDDELRVRLLREGAQDYVMKPFSREELQARVANLVSMKRARDVLRADLASQAHDLEALATEATARKRELRMALDSMRVARDQAERASRVKGDFLSLVSHELRTPLTVIQGYLHMLLHEGMLQLEPRYQEVVRKIGRSSARLVGLVDSLLEYARIESGRLTTRLEPLDLSALVAEVIDEFQPQAAQKKLELRLRAPAVLPPLRSDARLLRLVVFNLVGNALKYTDRGGVDVSLVHGEGGHRLAVRDTGPGISSTQQTTIFEPFAQLEPLRNKHTPGVGLGLALVRQMLEALGGHIELESRVGAGSTFTVILPEVAASEMSASA
jgi:signal transduction histidine kinase